MNKKILWSIVTFLFVAMIIGSVILYNTLSDQYDFDSANDKKETQQSLPERKKAADFVVYDIDGNAVKLSDFAGKPIVVNFWASWCPPCKQEMPDFEDAYKKYGDEVEFLMVNMTDNGRETVSSAKAFIDTTNYTFPVYYDISFSAAYAYQVVSMPSSYFIDRDGGIAAKKIGMISAEMLEKYIGMIIK